MAKEFPHVDVFGYDIVPPDVLSRPNEVPSNCHLELGDSNTDMDRYAGKMDVVNNRAAQIGIDDLDLHFYNVAQCLKPGGVFLISTADPYVSPAPKLKAACPLT